LLFFWAKDAVEMRSKTINSNRFMAINLGRKAKKIIGKFYEVFDGWKSSPRC